MVKNYIKMLNKKINTLLFLLFLVVTIFAQNTTKGDSYLTNQNTVIRIDGSQNSWVKPDNEVAARTNAATTVNENVSFSSTSEGIFINIISGANKIKLFALTGQLLLNGELTQGSFFIPTRNGIYFLKVNNKSFKVICK